LLVSTEPDEVKMQGVESKTIGISIKDRSAILPAGHMADGAYWYDSGSNNWVTSTYYRRELPDWAQKINAEHPAQRFCRRQMASVRRQGRLGQTLLYHGRAARRSATAESRSHPLGQ
jgi:hypothetical protein